MATATKRTDTVLSYLRHKVSLTEDLDVLAAGYKAATPFPYIVFDNFFPPAMLDGLLEELPPFTDERWLFEHKDELSKWNWRSAAELGDAGFQFMSFLHSAGFLYLMSEITGIKGLLPDPYLTGGAYHAFSEGGRFDVHADTNSDHHTGMLRRLAMLVYLNKDWKEEYGGNLELWSKDGTKCERVINPLFNRVVVFEIGDQNFHCVTPVTTGTGLIRRSFAIYFHTVDKNLVPHASLYAPPIYRHQNSLSHRIMKDALPPFVSRLAKRYLKK